MTAVGGSDQLPSMLANMQSLQTKFSADKNPKNNSQASGEGEQSSRPPVYRGQSVDEFKSSQKEE